MDAKARERHPPFVNILKQYPLDDPKRCGQSGEVTEEVDRSIGRRVWRIYGLISANTFVCFPNPGRPQSLAIKANYIYVQFKPVPNRFFVMHFDLNTAKNLGLRITLTNIVKKPKVWARVIQYPLLPPSRWVQVCLHVPSIVGQFTKLCPIGNTLSSVQICSSLYLRGLFTSDMLYTTDDLPRDLRLRENSGVRPPELLPWMYVPIGCRSTGCSQISCSSTDCSTPEPPNGGSALERVAPGLPSGAFAQGGGTAPPEGPDVIGTPLVGSMSSTQLITTRHRPTTDLFGARAVLQADRISGLCRPAQLRKRGAMWVGETRILSCHSSVLLHRNLTKKTSRCLLGHTGAIDFLEVSQDAALAATVENEMRQPAIRLWKLPAPETDSEDIRCTAIIESATLERISCLRLDPRGRYMVLVGCDRLGRQQLQVWELHGLLTTGRANLLARQVSDFQIEALRISPLEELRLVSCGKENIRFWRIKNAHLPGCNVMLDGLGRGNLFTDLDFALPRESARLPAKENDASTTAKLFVSSTCGSLLEVDYFTRAVRRVVTLHQSPIWAVAAGPGYCVTASADKAVKVWPLNFVAAYLSAEHGAECVGLDISPDGQQVLCTCGDSAVELLNLATQQHLPISRAHPARILDASISASLRELYTVCADGLVRVWSLPDLQQTFEMESPQDPPLRVAAHPTQRVFALGFASGSVRVLAVEGSAVRMEANHHRHPITGVWFVEVRSVTEEAVNPCARSTPQQLLQQSWVPAEVSGTGEEPSQLCSLVISLDASGCMCVFSQPHEFALIRLIETPQAELVPEGVPALVFAADGTRAARYLTSRKLCIFRLPKFISEEEIYPLSSACRSVAITAFCFSAAADALCVCGSDSTMRLFNLVEERGVTSFRQCREVPLLSGPITTAWVSCAESCRGSVPHVAVTCGADSLIKVWNLSPAEGSRRQTSKVDSNLPWLSTATTTDSAAARLSNGSPDVRYANSSSPVTRVAGCSAEFLQFQSFAGHNKPAFMVQLLGDYMVSVSPTETIAWTIGSPLISAAADVAPGCCGALPPPSRWIPPSSRLGSAKCQVQQQHHQISQQLLQQQPQGPQLEAPPPSSPQYLKQDSSKRVEELSGRPPQGILSLRASFGEPNDALLPSSAVAYAPEPERPCSTPAGTGGAITNMPADAATGRGATTILGRLEKSSSTASFANDKGPDKTSPITSTEALASVTRAEACISAADVANAEISRTHVSGAEQQKAEGPDGGGDTLIAEVFPGVPGEAAVLDTIGAHERRLPVTRQPQESASQLPFPRGAAARHVIGTAVAGCRSSCFWRPLNGILAHAVGNWVLLERLFTQAGSQEGRCLGLLPALLGSTGYIRTQQQKLWAGSPTRSATVHSTNHGEQQQQQLLLQQCSALAQKPRLAVLKHPMVGRPVAFSLDTAARIAATISVLTLTEPCSDHERLTGNRENCSSSSSCFSGGAEAAEQRGGETTTCWGLCLWRTEGGGELLGAACLPCGYGKSQGLLLEKNHGSRKSADSPAIDLPGVLFCGPDLVVTAGGAVGGRIDVWRVSDFLSPASCVSVGHEAGDNLPTASTPTKGSSISCLCGRCCKSCLCHVPSFEALRGGTTAAVGAEVEGPLRQLLSTASGDQREVVLVSPRSVTLWRILRDGSGPQDPRKDTGALELQLQFQLAARPRRLVSNPLENYTTACLTRRSKKSPRLLLVASDRGWVYGYNYDANVFIFELRLGDNAITSISCGKAMYLAYTTGVVARRTTMDLLRILEMHHAMGTQSVDIRSQATVQPLTLDAPIRTVQLDGDAQEGIATTAANTIWYLHWDKRAQVRLHSSHTLPIHHLAVSYKAKPAPKFISNFKRSRMQSIVKPQPGAPEMQAESEPLLMATADAGGTLRIWSRWPLPQQLAEFSLPNACTALSFLRPTLLLGCFSDGSLRMFDTRAFRIIGRLQPTAQQDPPVAIACLSDRHALLATASGELLSLIVDLRLKAGDQARATAGPEIKHASVSKIANVVKACFGPTFTQKQQMPLSCICISCSECGCGLQETIASARPPTPVEFLVGQRHAQIPSGKDCRVAFAFCLSGGYCAIGAYAKETGDNKWKLASTSCFGVRFGPESDSYAHTLGKEPTSQASFAGTELLLVARGSALYLVDCTAQQLMRQVSLPVALEFANPRLRWPVSVAAVCCPRADTAVIATEGGELLLVELPVLRVAGFGCHDIHPHLPRVPGSGATNPLRLAAYTEYEVALTYDCAISLVHVF